MESLKPTKQSEVFTVEKRFEQIHSLRERLGLVPLEIISYGSAIDTLSPTIGIEIEMSWMQAFPDMGAKWRDSLVRPSELHSYTPEYKAFTREYDQHDSKLRPVLEQVQKVIPRVGRDAYWEFSFLPSKNIGVSIAELQTLYDAQILHDGIHYATHMTVAEIDNDRDAFAFLCGLELSGGSSMDRIESAIHSTKGSWSRKGKGGILKRQPSELMGDDTDGYEFRTLTTTSLSQMTSLFLTARQLVLMMKNDKKEWERYRTHIESRIRDNDLLLKTWDKPTIDMSPWQKYAKLVGNR